MHSGKRRGRCPHAVAAVHPSAEGNVMILAPHSVALAPAFFSSKRIPFSNDSSSESSPGDTSKSRGREPGEHPASGLPGLERRILSAHLAEHSHACSSKTTDGNLASVDSHTKLRFQYDFQAADGTKIQIRLRANSSFSQEGQGTDAEQSLRIRARLKVTVVQEQVNAGAAPFSMQVTSPRTPERCSRRRLTCSSR